MFKLVYLDANPMNLRGKPVLAGLAVALGGAITPGIYRARSSGKTISLLNVGGKVLTDKSDPSGHAPSVPVTIDAALTPDIDVEDIYVSDAQEKTLTQRAGNEDNQETT